jgi:hypothetical protein
MSEYTTGGGEGSQYTTESGEGSQYTTESAEGAQYTTDTEDVSAGADEEVAFDPSLFPEFGFVAQFSDFDGLMAGLGVDSIPEACNEKVSKAATSSLQLLGALAAVLGTPGLLKIPAVAVLIAASVDFVEAFVELSDCLEQNGHPEKAAVIRQHADALAAETARLQALVGG